MKADVCTHCRYPGGRAIIDVFSGVCLFEFSISQDSFEDEEARLTDIKNTVLGPGVAAASERAAILDTSQCIMGYL